MTATIERTEYFPEVKEFARWTNASPLNRFSRYDETRGEFHELISRTTCLDDNGFKAAREYRVRRNGHYKLVNIYVCFLGGCCITEKNF